MGNPSGTQGTDPALIARFWQLAETIQHDNGEPNLMAISREMGVKRQTLQNWKVKGKPEEPVSFPAGIFDSVDEPIDDVIERMERQFVRKKQRNDALKWFPLQIHDDKPVGILFVGDPHVDDNGCNWPALRQHARICAETEGMYAVNIGDSTNCWGGRLIKKYADQDASVHTARRLVEWLLLDSGFRWLVWLMGNHEHMGDGAPLLHEMNKRHGTSKVPMLDWEARFRLRFASGAEFKINTAHDFPGNSMWNPIHGAVKAAMFGNDTDVLVCGHKHNWAVSQWELAEQGNSPLMIRVRGYKHSDDYAKRIGKYEQDHGQSILVVFNPLDTGPSRVQPFTHIERGAEYLTWLRGS